MCTDTLSKIIKSSFLKLYFCAPQSQQFLKLMNTDSFALRHIGPRPENISEMLKTIGVDSLDQLIYETLPDGIKLEKELDLPEALSEQEYLEHITKLAQKNKLLGHFLGRPPWTIKRPNKLSFWATFLATTTTTRAYVKCCAYMAGVGSKPKANKTLQEDIAITNMWIM
mgnify:CR=1 FL=1